MEILGSLTLTATDYDEARKCLKAANNLLRRMGGKSKNIEINVKDTSGSRDEMNKEENTNE